MNCEKNGSMRLMAIEDTSTKLLFLEESWKNIYKGSKGEKSILLDWGFKEGNLFSLNTTYKLM